MTATENQLRTHKLFVGFWKCLYKEGEINKEIQIVIRDNNFYINYLENGESINNEKHPSGRGWHWFGENHLSLVDTDYYVTSANETEMIFGKLKTAGVFGPDIWRRKFERAADFKYQE